MCMSIILLLLVTLLQEEKYKIKQASIKGDIDALQKLISNGVDVTGIITEVSMLMYTIVCIQLDFGHMWFL